MNNKKTSSSVASIAARALRKNDTSKIQRRLAGSALSQMQQDHQTGKQIETAAAKVLRSPRYSKETKQLAGSVLAQSNSNR